MIAGIIGLAGLVVYGAGIVVEKGTMSPMSWAIWAFGPVVVWLAFRSENAGQITWLPAAEAVGTLGVLVLALRYGRGVRVAPWEWWLAAGIAAALIAWRLTGLPGIAIIAPAVIDVAGTWPTMVDDYKDPSRETTLMRISWAMLVAAGIVGFAEVGPAGAAAYAYPAGLTLMGLMVLGAVYAKPLTQPRPRRAVR